MATTLNEATGSRKFLVDTMSSAAALLKDPLLLANLVFRLFLLGYVLWQGNWSLGDTAHYMHFASRVCGGDWGGEAGKGPFYLWYLCLLSPHIHYPALTSTVAAPPGVTLTWFVALPLFMQTIAVWMIGGLFANKFKNRLIAALWLFDPVLLVFSSVIMPEALFCVSLALTSLIIWKMYDEPSSITKSRALLLGSVLAVVALIRTNGLLLMIITVPLLVWMMIKNRLRLNKIFLVLLGFGLVITPRVYWNGTRYGHFTLANQGSGWIKSVAGVVENHDTGLDFPSSEQKWWKEHPIPNDAAAWQTLIKNPVPFAMLTMKGMLRVLFGHVNVEWGSILTGSAPVGPGWWHPQESRKDGLRVEGALLIVWVLGMLVTAGLSLLLYTLTIRGVWAQRHHFDAFHLWCLLLIFLQALMPLVYGEARFRSGVFPFVLILLLRTYSLRLRPGHLNSAQAVVE